MIKQNYIEIVNDENDNVLFKPSKDYDLSMFLKEEIEVMDKVLNKLKGKTSTELTEWSHKFKGWTDTTSGEIIDYKHAEYFELDKN